MILNRQRRVRVPVRKLEEFLERARRILRVSPGDFGICFVTDTQIARWNRAYRGKNRPTDVLSFPAGGAKRRRKRIAARKSQTSDSGSYLGDIAIAPAVARRNARRFGRKFDDEMRILILHGILHLLGYDHETDNGQMERRERKLRRLLRLS
jgi:probable rRNA maturation factor